MMRLIGLVLAVLLWSAPAWADGTIDTLSAGATLTGTELLPMFQTANPAVTTTPNALKTFIGGGTVTSISAGCGSSTGGSAITTTGTIASVETVSLQTGSNYAVTNANCGQLVDLSNASAETPTIAQAGSGGNFTSGWYADICNIGAGTQTLTPATSTINGAATLPIIKGMCYRVVSDGTNYQTVGAGTFGTTGSGNLVYATSPTLVTPILGTPTSVTLNNTSDVIGGVTMTLGSDATGDMYYRNSSGVLTRLAVCTGSNVVGASGGLPACVAQSGGGGITANSTTTTSFSAGQLVYSDGTLAQASAGITTPGTGQLLLALGTITTNLKAINITGTFNASGTTFDAPIFMNITNTASAAGTLLMDFQVGSSSVFQVSKAGQILAPSTSSTSVASDSIGVIGGNLAIGFNTGSGQIFFNNNTAVRASVDGGGYFVSNDGTFAFSSSTPVANAVNKDTYLSRGGAAATIQHGAADAAAPVAQIVKFQSVVAGTSNTAGVNSTYIGSLGTGTGPSGNMIFEVGKTGTTGSTQNTGFPLLTLNAGNATGATVQFGDGTNFTTYDSCTGLTTGATGIIACTASAMRFKTPLGQIISADLSVLHPAVWKYKDPARFGEGYFVGLYADDVERLDERCVTHDPDGQLKDYRDRCVIAYLVSAVQKQQAEIGALKRRVR
jgi:hypothetical protein